MNNYIKVHYFMMNHLKLKGVELILYAIIYNYTIDKKEFTGSSAYLEKIMNVSARAIFTAFDNLIEKNYIIKERKNNYCIYKANMKIFDKKTYEETSQVTYEETSQVGMKKLHREYEETSQEPMKKLQFAYEETSHNIKDNIKDDRKDYNRFSYNIVPTHTRDNKKTNKNEKNDVKLTDEELKNLPF